MKYKIGDIVWCRCYPWLAYVDGENPEPVYIGPVRIIDDAMNGYNGDYLVRLPVKVNESSSGNYAIKKEWIDHIVEKNG